jgi:hypothetical protein
VEAQLAGVHTGEEVLAQLGGQQARANAEKGEQRDDRPAPAERSLQGLSVTFAESLETSHEALVQAPDRSRAARGITLATPVQVQLGLQ